MADEAFCIGPPPARESYLRSDRILEVGCFERVTVQAAFASCWIPAGGRRNAPTCAASWRWAAWLGQRRNSNYETPIILRVSLPVQLLALYLPPAAAPVPRRWRRAPAPPRCTQATASCLRTPALQARALYSLLRLLAPLGFAPELRLPACRPRPCRPQHLFAVLAVHLFSLLDVCDPRLPDLRPVPHAFWPSLAPWHAGACEERGIAFVGPPAAAIRAMGDKSEAKVGAEG